MIVKDKKEIIDRSGKLSNKYLKLIDKEARKFIKDDDPSSMIYFNIYCVSMALAKISIGIEKFCQIYKIDNLDSSNMLNIVNEVSKDIINSNINNVH